MRRIGIGVKAKAVMLVSHDLGYGTFWPCITFLMWIGRQQSEKKRGLCTILYDKGKGAQPPDSMTRIPCTSVSANSWEIYVPNCFFYKFCSQFQAISSKKSRVFCFLPESHGTWQADHKCLAIMIAGIYRYNMMFQEIILALCMDYHRIYRFWVLKTVPYFRHSPSL